MIGFYDYTVVLTYLSLFSAVTGLYFCFTRHPVMASICLILCALLDAFDGMVARTKKDRTEAECQFGIQIDSLTDLIAFGVLPTMIGAVYVSGLLMPVYVAISGLFVLAALIRLAYFNVQENDRQKVETGKRRHYNGLPVTSSGAIFPSVVMVSLLMKHGFPIFVYMGAVVFTGFAFLVRSLRIKKPSFRVVLVFCVLGALGIATLVLLWLRRVSHGAMFG